MSYHEVESEEIIYHYCSSATFLSIIQNKKIWLTDLMSSNDSLEARWTIKKYLEERDYDSPRAETYVNRFFEERLSERYVLGCCFSKKRDLLSQWRGYAVNGKGVCIGFRRSALENLAEAERAAHMYTKLVTVEYVDEIPSGISEQISCIAETALRFLTQNTIWVDLHITPAPTEGRKFSELVSNFLTLKNPAFSEEEEMRLLAVGDASSASNVKFREASGLLSPYVEIGISGEMIASIVLGPTNATPKSYVYRLLNNHGFRNADVQNSSASFVGG